MSLPPTPPLTYLGPGFLALASALRVCVGTGDLYNRSSLLSILSSFVQSSKTGITRFWPVYEYCYIAFHFRYLIFIRF